MTDYIFDAEPHAIDKNLAYILKKVRPEEGADLKDETLSLYKKYAEYLLACDKEKAIEYIMKVFQHYLDFQNTPDDVSIIYRAPDMCDCLCQFGTLAIKFKRGKDDILVTP